MKRLLVVMVCVCAVLSQAADIKVMNWNLLNYPGSDWATRSPYMRTVVGYATPDVMVCQEVIGANGLNTFQNQVLAVLEPGVWVAAAFHDGYDSDNALYMRSGVVEQVSAGWLTTALREIAWWQLREIDSGREFRVYSMHLKANQGEEAARLAEVTILRANLASLPVDLPVMIMGDFNLYTSTEPAYQHLLAAGAGAVFDPINRPGNWHNSSSFADIHTQSTRTEQFGGGATGGLDDRFDFLLVSDDFLDTVLPEALPATYTPLGNDGDHFNVSINLGGNTAVPLNVADALYYSSDHLPVTCEFSFPSGASAAPLPPPLASLDAWPNPFNPTVSLRLQAAQAGSVDLVVYDLAGRQVAQLWHGPVSAGGETVTWQPQDLSSGVYVARLARGGETIASQALVLTK